MGVKEILYDALEILGRTDGIPYEDIVGSIDHMYLTREKSIRNDMDKNEAENH